MSEKIPAILIFDIGKTNKKLLLFDEQYRVIHEEARQFTEISDEDGFPCEDIIAITKWVKDLFNKLVSDDRFEIKGINFSAYGASFVCLDENLEPVPPMCNYLKPFPAAIQKKFYSDYGGESAVSKRTASPASGNLNSGMQLYRLKQEKPGEFKKIKYALHLPQYLSFILSGSVKSDITSIGCHTNLWNFQQHHYDAWVEKEGILEKLAPLAKSNEVAAIVQKNIPVGIGLHDSSAALIPYLISFNEPFVLISTGTWCISLNPFNHGMLTDYELHKDCLCYLSYEGRAVKASRLFAGYEHEQAVKKLADQYNKPADYYMQVNCDPLLLKRLKHSRSADAGTYEEAYHLLMIGIIEKQLRNTNLIMKEMKMKRIFVDGGFSKNSIYMYLLAAAFPEMEVYAATMAQASATGAALIFHQHWNRKEIPADLIDLKLYTVTHEMGL